MTALVTLVCIVNAAVQIRLGIFAFDFKGTIWQPAHSILEGRSPVTDDARRSLEMGNPAIYPPLGPLLAVPLTVLPFGLAAGVWTALLVGATFVALRLLGVTDWRCYVLAFTSPVIQTGVLFGNVALLVLLGVAAAWRWRQRARVGGGALGLAVALKLYAFPLAAWPASTRRPRLLRWTLLVGILAVLVPWGISGFAGLGAYPSVLRTANDIYAPHGFSLAAAASALGLGAVRSLVCFGVGLALIAVALRHRRAADGEFACFALLVLAAVVVTPIAWPYTFSLLVVPIALATPNLSGLWWALPTFWLAESLPHPRDVVTVCCRPEATPSVVWDSNHLPSPLLPPLAFALLAVTVTVAAMAVHRRAMTTSVVA